MDKPDSVKHGNPIKWSWSALKDFNTCPRQYNEVRVKQNFKKEENVHSNTGKLIHTALELYVRDNVDLPPEYKSYEKYVRPLLDETSGSVHTEFKVAVRPDKLPCAFDSDDYWVRGIIDLLILDHDNHTAYIVDYKTGNNRYADLRQLKLMACLVFAHYDDIDICRVGLLFLNFNDFIPAVYERGNLAGLWSSFSMDLARLDMAFKLDKWAPNPTGLCKKYCPVLTCQFNGRG
jgi:hypothetical protein